jgi:hypothetical protein
MLLSAKIRLSAGWWLGVYLLLGTAGKGIAQQAPAPLTVALDSVAVAPQAIHTQGWLLLDKDIQVELDGAVHNLYNFKFDRADRQFRSLRRRYPQHPLAYFLLGLSTWWKMIPLAPTDPRYDRQFYAYLDTATTKAHALYKADARNYEACFFLAAAYGFAARLHAERRDWRKATVSSRRALDYLQQSRPANGLSSEFELGFGLFDYYAVWIGEKYPWLRPVLFFFPKGNREQGLAELQRAARTAFYAKTEAAFFLLLILPSAREQQAAQALGLARQLATEFPDNSRFQVDYARLCFDQGQWDAAEATCQAILAKNSQGYVGYEALTGRTAAYILGYLYQHRYHNPAKAQDYYRRCLVFSETIQLMSGYYVFANAALGTLAAQQRDVAAACRYYAVVVDIAGRHELQYQAARAYLRRHNASSRSL